MLGDVGQIEIVQANIRDTPSIERALEGAEGCINAVGVLYESGRQRFPAIHVDGASAVAKAAAERGIERLLHISALGAGAHSPSAYGRSKAAGEAAVRKAFPTSTIVRPSVVFGPDDHFFNRFAALATISPVLPLIGGGATLFQPVFVGDVAAGAARALDEPGAAGSVFEFGGPAVYSFRQLMELTLKEIGRRRWLAPVPFFAARLIGLAGDAMALAGLPPPLTSDQVALLAGDSIVSPAARTLADLGVAASAVEPVIPTYLYRYRKAGQYAVATLEGGDVRAM
jgi:NADH dehydrogenase